MRGTITVGSMFRNSEQYLSHYFGQIEALREFFDVHLVLAEGDSSDGTLGKLVEHLDRCTTLLHITHGGPAYGSVDDPRRWEQVAYVFSKLISKVDEVHQAFVWMEADLLWAPSTIATMVEDLRTFSAVCPMVFCNDRQRFYDVWGYRIRGERFEAGPPYHTDLLEPATIVPMDSCGSCFAVRPEVVDELREWGGRWPLRLPKTQLYLDKTVSVIHP